MDGKKICNFTICDTWLSFEYRSQGVLGGLSQQFMAKFDGVGIPIMSNLMNWYKEKIRVDFSWPTFLPLMQLEWR